MKDIVAASVQFQHSPGDKKHNLETMRRFVQRASDQGVDLLCFPEMCITGYWHVRRLSRGDIDALAEPVPDGPSIRALLELSSTFGMTIGAGLIERADNGALYNSYVVAMPDGAFACHRKLHCFISEHMSSGQDYTVFDTPQGVRVAVLICYDNNMIENARMCALHGAEVLMAPHQTGGCDSRSPKAMGLIDPDLWRNRKSDPAPLQKEFRGPKGREWLMRWLPARAHDNGMFLLFSNGVGLDDNEVRTGNAMIIGPYGEILAESKQIEDDMVVTTLRATDRESCTGLRWLRGRRPELYRPLSQNTGAELGPHKARFT